MTRWWAQRAEWIEFVLLTFLWPVGTALLWAVIFRSADWVFSLEHTEMPYMLSAAGLAAWAWRHH